MYLDLFKEIYNYEFGKLLLSPTAKNNDHIVVNGLEFGFIWISIMVYRNRSSLKRMRE